MTASISVGGKSWPPLEKIKLFCKSNSTIGVSIKNLHRMFIDTPNSPAITQYQFESALLTLNKKVMFNLKNECLNFIKDNDSSWKSYENFNSDYQYITKDLWDHFSNISGKDGPQPESQKDKMPINWDLMPFHDRINFIKGIKQDDEFKVYVIASDPRIKKYLNLNSRSILPEMAPQDTLVIETHSKVLPPKARLLNPPYSKLEGLLKQSPEKPKSPSPQPQPEIDAPEKPKSHKDKMPLDWTDMDFSDRVNFTIAIKDEEFKAYVLAQDPKIKSYIGRLEKRKESNQPIYLTLFSFDANSATPKAKALVKNLIDALNKLGRARLQYLELKDPPIVEIREVR